VARRLPRFDSVLLDGQHERCRSDSSLKEKTMLRCTIVAFGLFVLALGLSPASEQPGPPRLDVPPVPMKLEVPAGHEVYLGGYAVGTQNYVCVPANTESGVGWRFLGPQATLFRTTSGDPRQQLTTHFLSVNPADHLARPTWQHSIDSSRVWGRVKESSNDSNFVAPGAIDWLLVEPAGADPGPIGSGVLAGTTFIHRVNTSGGTAPVVGCANVSQIGTLALVPYSTDYFFYRATSAP
jgi:hypothetical protein